MDKRAARVAAADGATRATQDAETAAGSETPSAAEMTGSFMRIDQVAEATGLTKRSIRYYEELGLLAAPLRSEGNYRLFSPQDLERLQRIVQLKSTLGLSLTEIQDMVGNEEEIADLRATFWNEEHTPGRDEKLAILDRAAELLSKQLELVQQKRRAMDELAVSLNERMERLKRRRSELLKK